MIITRVLLCLQCGVFAAQMAEIRKFRYAKLLCANADFMPHIQPNVFFHPLSVVNDIVRSVDHNA